MAELFGGAAAICGIVTAWYLFRKVVRGTIKMVRCRDSAGEFKSGYAQEKWRYYKRSRRRGFYKMVGWFVPTLIFAVLWALTK